MDRRGYGSGGVLCLSSPFGDLVELWLADLESRDLAANTKANYRDDLRVHVRPFFEHYTLGEITTGRVERFLKTEAAVSYSRAKHSRNILNHLVGFALRHDALPRNPLEGTSPLAKPKTQIQALTLQQMRGIRAAAVIWRREPGRSGPKPDDKVRDIIEGEPFVSSWCWRDWRTRASHHNGSAAPAPRSSPEVLAPRLPRTTSSTRQPRSPRATTSSATPTSTSGPLTCWSAHCDLSVPTVRSWHDPVRRSKRPCSTNWTAKPRSRRLGGTGDARTGMTAVQMTGHDGCPESGQPRRPALLPCAAWGPVVHIGRSRVSPAHIEGNRDSCFHCPQPSWKLPRACGACQLDQARPQWIGHCLG